MSIVGPLRKFSADVLDSNTFSGRFRKYLTLKVFRYVYVWRKFFILFKLANRAIRVRYNADFIKMKAFSLTHKKGFHFLKFNSRFIFLWYTNGRCHIIK